MFASRTARASQHVTWSHYGCLQLNHTVDLRKTTPGHKKPIALAQLLLWICFIIFLRILPMLRMTLDHAVGTPRGSLLLTLYFFFIKYSSLINMNIAQTMDFVSYNLKSYWETQSKQATFIQSAYAVLVFVTIVTSCTSVEEKFINTTKSLSYLQYQSKIWTYLLIECFFFFTF